MSLRKALKAVGMTQAELAKSLGVSDAAVNHWVTGKRPIPADRVPQLETLLSVDLSSAVVDYERLMEQGRTPIGYAILWPIKDVLAARDSFVEPRSEQDFRRRTVAWASQIDVPRSELEQAILGNKLLPIDAVRKIGDIAAHVHNPAIMAEQVGFQEPEARALYSAVQEMSDAETFTEATRMLLQAKQEWQGAGLYQDVERATAELDNGNDNDEIEWWLQGDSAPEVFTENTRQQDLDLTGRFRSGT